ncbi:MAG: hypothetical protein JO273_06050 [Methylobacteriaceae bacterium]|nr:hypothetical protein [Methylobacteriaceae bacterium]
MMFRRYAMRFVMAVIAALAMLGAASAQSYFPPPMGIDPGPPPMDMTWGFESQQRLYDQGMKDADNIFKMCMQYPAACRGASPQSLQDSINRLNEQYQRNFEGWQRNSEANERAIDAWDKRVLRGCTQVVNDEGQLVWACP